MPAFPHIERRPMGLHGYCGRQKWVERERDARLLLRVNPAIAKILNV
jgi:hypothetical protein